MANIAPLAYTCASTLWPHRMLEVPVIYIIISLGGASCFLLAFLWRVTSPIAGTEHSTALFALQFCLALVDCTSSVAFLPFMSVFKPQYMTAYFIGEGFSGLIPSLIALGQGAGNMKCVSVPKNGTNTSKNIETDLEFFRNETLTLSESTLLYGNNTSLTGSLTSVPVYQPPRFSVKIFFLLLMIMMIISALSFTLLNFWPYCRREHVGAGSFKNVKTDTVNQSILTTVTAGKEEDDLETSMVVGIKKKAVKVTAGSAQNKLLLQDEPVDNDAKSRIKFRYFEADSSSDDSENADLKNKTTKMSKQKYALFLIVTAYLNALSNGILPSIQTYSCLPYGIQEYHLSVTLASIANPVACFVAFFKKMTSLTWTLGMTFVSSALTGYILWTASASPDPPLVNHYTGSVILV